MIPKNKMLKYYKDSTVRCSKCGFDIGDYKLEKRRGKDRDCPKCGCSMFESLVEWVEDNLRPAYNGDYT